MYIILVKDNKNKILIENTIPFAKAEVQSAAQSKKYRSVQSITLILTMYIDP
jgi:hypothetical protein